MVLLRNGRRKDEAAKELEVFLSDNNEAFVSWLFSCHPKFSKLFLTMRILF